MIAAITAFFTALPVAVKMLAPIVALIMGWLAPSPLQKATAAPAEVENAEKKADAGDPSDLDHP